MKKILALIMIFMLSFTMISCGGGNDSDNQQDDITDTQTENIDDESDDNDDSPEVLDPDELTMKEDEQEDYDLEAEYDLGIKADDNFKMDSVIKKLNYKDLEGLQSEITSLCESATKKVFGTEFSFQSDYEADDEMDFDKHVYVGGVEGTELDNAYAETGAYHEKATGKYHQYTNYSSKTYYEYSDKTVENIIKTLKDAYGITLSERKTKKAVKLAFDTAKENDDFYSLVDKVKLKGNGYSETITVTVDGFVNEGDEGGDYGFYIFVDRDRVYS